MALLVNIAPCMILEITPSRYRPCDINFIIDKIRQQKGQLSVSQRSRGDSNVSGISVKNSSSIRTLEELQARISLLEGENAQLQRKITEKDRIIGIVTKNFNAIYTHMYCYSELEADGQAT